MVADTLLQVGSIQDTVMDLSMVPKLVVGNATGMHSIEISFLGAFWAHDNKQMSPSPRPTECFKSLKIFSEPGQCCVL
jgi:hypothetical protein